MSERSKSIGPRRGSRQTTARSRSVASSIVTPAPTSIGFGTSRPSTTTGRKSRTTTASSILGQSDSHSIVCAISEARGVTPTVGVAFVNVALGEVTLSQICDNQSYVKSIHKIQMLAPARLVLMSASCPPNRPCTLFSLLEELVPEAQITAFDRSAWSETAGLDYIQTLAFESEVGSTTVSCQGKYYAISSFSAVSILRFRLGFF